MDIVGPLPETLKGNKYIVTLTDYFSKWAEAAALPNKSAEGVAIFMHSVSMFAEILDIVVAIASSSYSLWKLYRGPCAPTENHDKVYIVIATNKQTKNIIVIIFLQVMCRFGCPEVVITDHLLMSSHLGYTK